MTSAYDRDLVTRLAIKRLAEANSTRAKVESLERRADLLAETALERRKAELLSDLSTRVAALGPQLRDMSHHVAELKAYLQSVYDADLLGDSILQQVASEHCIGYTVRLLDLLSEPSKYATKGATDVLELATSTLAMFAARPSAAKALVNAGAVSVAIKLLSPLFPTVVVVNVANAVGSLAAGSAARIAFRAAGGVGALVRLLRPDVEAAAQTSAAAALSLLAANDTVIQDSVRYLGGLDHLVDLLASPDTYTAEVARYALQALRHGNTKNQAEIITSVRANSALARDLRKLDAASELLTFEDSLPLRVPRLPSYGSAREVRALIDQLSTLSSGSTLETTTRRALSTLRPLTTSDVLRTSRYLSPSRSPASKATAYLSPPSSPRIAALSPDSTLSWSAGSSLVELESELLRKKHLGRFTTEEVQLLLQELGFDDLDLRGFRVHHVDGAALIDLTEDAMLAELVLPRARVRKLRTLQKATLLFDRIATLPRQGKVSEMEVRLFLAGQGASTTEVNKVVKLLRTLVRTDRYEFISFWDFVTSYDWIAQALRIYNIPV